MAIFAALLAVVRSSDINSDVVMSLAMYFTLLCACIVVGHLLEENRWANESIIALLIGLGTGLLMLLISKGKSSKILSFDEDLFFIFLLPPIIFNAGFQVKKKQFFHNFSTILLFAVFGTIISFCLISLGAFLVFKRMGLEHLSSTDFLAIGAILSATDSVCTLQILNQEETPFLYSIVFGEGVVNDATSIVLFNSVQALDFSNITASTALTFLWTFLYLFFTSTLLGIAMGLVSAFVIKTLYFGRHSTDREIAIMMLMAYLSYMIAELLDLSGILTIFFCGIVMSHYTWHNTTESSRITTKHSFATISFIAETFIFLYVGMDALDIDKWKLSNASVGTSVAISSTMLLLVLVGRAAFVFPLANIANLFKTGKDNKIELRQQFIMWWAGLMRGAVTIALSYNRFSKGKQEYALMITSTIIVVLFSTVVFGSITKPLIEKVLLRHSIPATSFGRSNSPTLEDLRLLIEDGAGPSDEGSSSVQLERRASSLQLLIRYPAHTVHYYWRKFDDKYMRPIFGGRGFVPGAPRTPPSPENLTS